MLIHENEFIFKYIHNFLFHESIEDSYNNIVFTRHYEKLEQICNELLKEVVTHDSIKL